MESIPIRVLNQDTAGVMTVVERGEVVEVTNRGRPIARIVPVGATRELADLVLRGRVIPATRSEPFAMPPGEIDTAIDSAQIVSELRDDRL
jgi:prevent-host-death family protein